MLNAGEKLHFGRFLLYTMCCELCMIMLINKEGDDLPMLKSRKAQALSVLGNRRLNKEKTHWQLLLLLLPALIYIIIFNYWPMYGIQIAFKNYSARKGIIGSPWVGFQYFKQFLEYPFFWQILRNTLTLSVYALIAGFPFPIILALLLNEVWNQRFKSTVQMVVFVPHFISTVALCGMLALFFDRGSGIVNAMLEKLGHERFAFMSDGPTFKHLYVWSAVWQNSGFASVIYMAALANVDGSLIEAATIDGANRWQIVYHINFKSILPVVITQLILKVGHLMSVGFEKVLLLQNDLNMQYSDVISTYVYRNGLAGAQFSYTTAIGLFNNIINLILLLTVNYIVNRYSDNAI